MKQQLLCFGLCCVLFSPLFLRLFFYFCLDVCFVFLCRRVLMSNQLSTPNFINTPDVTLWATTCPPQPLPCGFTVFFFFFFFNPAQTKIGWYKDSQQQQTSCLLFCAKTQQKYGEFDPPCRSYEQGQIKIESQFKAEKKYIITAKLWYECALPTDLLLTQVTRVWPRMHCNQRQSSANILGISC